MTWFEVLKAARKLDQHGNFTAIQLVVEAGIQNGERSTASQIASAWLGKFILWGYADRVEQNTEGEKKPTGRPQTLYTLTKYGRTRKKPTTKLPAHPSQRKNSE